MSYAAAALGLFAADPAGFGAIVLRGPASPGREAWLAALSGLLRGTAPVTRLPVNVDDGRLLGGLDLVATLAAGRPVMQRGLLASHADGVMIVPMAERLAPAFAGHLARSLDHGGPALVLLDESEGPDEALPPILAERAAAIIRPEGFDAAPAMVRFAVRPALPLSDEQLVALAALAASLGIGSVRPLAAAARIAGRSAALAGRDAVLDDDLALAVRLALAPRALHLPAVEPDGAADARPDPPPPAPGDQATDERALPPDAPLEDRLVEAAMTALPAGLLGELERARAPRSSAAAASGGSGARRRSLSHGRPLGSRAGMPGSGRRLALIDTLRTAAPWQRLRGRDDDGRLRIARSDLRIRRYADRETTLVILAVDASGSAALERLGEAKGAVELLLAEAYVKRTEVAVIAFRGDRADLILPPTRSLVRAKRALADLPGGGTTPLVSAISEAGQLAASARRKGTTPLLVLLTDGRGNIAGDGSPDRVRAAADLDRAARLFAAAGHRAVVIDIAARPRDDAASLATRLGARYASLPRLDAQGVRRIVETAMPAAA